MKNLNTTKDIFIEPLFTQDIDLYIKNIDKYLEQKSAKVYLDLRSLNMFDAIRMGALFSTHMLAFDISSKLEVLSDCKEVIKQLKLLGLSNMKVSFSEKFEQLSEIVV